MADNVLSSHVGKSPVYMSEAIIQNQIWESLCGTETCLCFLVPDSRSSLNPVTPIDQSIKSSRLYWSPIKDEQEAPFPCMWFHSTAFDFIDLWLSEL